MGVADVSHESAFGILNIFLVFATIKMYSCLTLIQIQAV